MTFKVKDGVVVGSTTALDANGKLATGLSTARTISLSGDVTGSATFDGTADATITATIAANSVALGTDTTGNYVASLAAGTGIAVGAAGEGATPTITNTAPNVTTDISITHNTGSVVVNSSDGLDGTINAATTILAGVMSSTDKTKLDGIASGATANTGTVTSVSGTGTVSGLTLSGTVTTSGSLTLGGTLSASIDNITDEHRIFNNMGQTHSTQTDFNAISDFGVRYVQGGTNGPTGVSSNQFYGFTLGLGNDYALSNYASQFYWPRAAQNADTYIYVRDREGGTWGSWRKTKAGYADTAGSTTTAGYATSAGTADQIDGVNFRNTGSNSGVNADTLDSNGITYYTAGVTNFSGNATDGALYSQAYSSSWQHQIAGDYRSGQIAVRGKNSGTWQSWYKILQEDTWQGNKYFGSAGAIYGTIFYDSNDTSYYVDPNNTSYQRNLFLGAHDSGASEFRFGEDSAGWYGDRWYWDSSYTLYRYSRYAGTDSLIHYHDTRDASRITYGRNIVFDDYGKGIVGTYSSYRYQGVFSMGDSYKLPADGTTTGNLYGMAWSHPNAGGTAGNLNTHGLLILENGGFLAAVSGSIRSRDDMRSPIFYDSNNTAYYVDPNGSSRLGSTYTDNSYTYGWFRTWGSTGLYNQDWGNHWYSDGAYWNIAYGGTTGIRLRVTGHGGTIAGYYYGDTSLNSGLLNQSGSWKVRVNGSDTEIYDYCYANDLRTYIMYDRNDTGYYADPASTSRLNNVNANNGNWYGVTYFYANRNTTSDSPALQAYSDNGSGAIMSFHRGGYYAVNMGLDSDNVFRIGGWSASANRLQMDMSGNLTMAGNITANSDETLKKDWKSLSDGFIEDLANVKSGTYTRIDTEERQAGSSAQDWQKLLPEVVSKANDGILSLAYGNAALVSAIELAKRVVEQDARIAKLEERLSKLLGD